MNRTYILLLLGLLATAFVHAQKVTIDLHDRPMQELLDAVFAQTGYPVYCHPSVKAGRVSVTATNLAAETVLQQALLRTTYKVSKWENIGFFILDNQEMFTSLPSALFSGNRRQEEESYAGLILFKNKEKATSENKVYEVGSKNSLEPMKATISGTIVDFKSGEAVPDVSIVVGKPWKATTSNAKGYFELELPTGKHELQISGVNIKDTRRQILLDGDGQLDILLEEEQYALEEVTVSAGKRENVHDVQMGVEKLQMKEIKNIPTAFGETDILRAIQALPGVTTAGEASSGLNVRGGATDQNLILFNDGTIYNPTHLFGFFSAINSDMVKDMELFKSSIPAKYGGRISSVLDIQSKEGNKEKFAGSAGIGLLTSRLTLEVPVIKNRTSVLFSGRTTYSDWILKNLPEKSGYNQGNAGFYDLGGTISHRFNKKSSLSLNGYYSNDRFNLDAYNKYNYTNANASARWKHIFSESFVGTLTAGYDHYDYETTDKTKAESAYRLQFAINQLYAKLDFQSQLTETNKLNFGFSSLLYNIDPGTYSPSGDSSLVMADRLEREKALESAIYAEDTWHITPRLSVSAGIRLSMFNALGARTYNVYEEGLLPDESSFLHTETAPSGNVIKTYMGPEYRLSARYALTDHLSVKAGYNTMRQYIHKISNNTVMSPTDTWKLSDPNIRPQQGSQFAAGVYWNPMDGELETSIEGYYKTLDDYLDYRNGAQLSMNHHLETEVINTQGKAYGIEAMIKKPQGKLNGWLSYTYSRTFLRQNSPLVTEPVNEGNWYPAEYDKPHNVNMVGNYKFTQRYSISLNSEYSTGRPITLPVSKYYDHQLGTEIIYYSKRNANRVSDYFRLDVAFNIEPSHKLTVLTHSSFSIGIYNVTARKNVYSIYYVTENGKIQGYKMSIFGMPIPYITYNIKF